MTAGRERSMTVRSRPREKEGGRPTALFRADASAAIGGGHVMRCLVLADALSALGWRCSFAVATDSGESVAALARSGHEVVELDAPSLADWAPPAPAEWLIVDGYHLDAGVEERARAWARGVMAIDDLADRRHGCDLLLDQTPGRQASAYARLTPESCGFLLGPDYALLRPAFRALRDAALERHLAPAAPQRLLVACGNSDAPNLTAMVIAAIEEAGLEVEVDVVLGGKAPHLTEIRDLAARLRRPAKLHVDTADMAGLMAEADIAIGAAGTTVWERCCLGLPGLVAVIADNQAENARVLAERGAAVSLGRVEDLSAARIGRELAALAGDHPRRRAMAAAAAALCDGLGATRVAMRLAPETARDGGAVWLRPAERADGGLMLDWQRAPGSRRWARNPAVPSEAEHWAWLDRKLVEPGCLLHMVEHAGAPAGVLRLDRLDGERGSPRYEVSILVAPERLRLGIGAAALRLARRLLPEAVILAAVHPDNAASQALFRGAGYLPARDGFASYPETAPRPSAAAGRSRP